MARAVPGGAIASPAIFWLGGVARFTVLTILLSAPVVYLRLHRVDFAIGDLVQGVLLLVPALLAKASPASHGSVLCYDRVARGCEGGVAHRSGDSIE